MKRLLKQHLLLFLLTSVNFCIKAQVRTAVSAGNGNPIIPGYFADPTVRKFGDTYYIYATTDGNGGGHGPSQVWTSKDFVNWSMQDMNWPTSTYYWAPDVIQGNDKKYYLYYCQPVDIYGASSASPTGPWTPLLPGNKSMIPNYFVPGVITLDGQTFKDDDGKIYMFWGTWGIYPDHGCGVGLLNPDMHTFAKTAKIANTDAKEFFEAPFMFKRKGIYYLTYSSGLCENDTYRVQYAMSKTGPFGPFTFGKNNPVLSTSADGSVHGPGHQSVIQVGDDYYMVYHRHNNPHSNGGYHRQVCADKIEFDEDGSIKKLIPTHKGIGALGKSTQTGKDLAYLQTVKASSYYNDNYIPGFAVDNNNGTLWRPAKNNADPQWIQIDLGKLTPVKQIETQFEYATWFYQYRLHTSADGKNWQLFADRSKNTQHGSPMIDRGNAVARYIKLTITDTEYPGLFKAIWNIKAFGENSKQIQPANLITVNKKPVPEPVHDGLLAGIDVSDLQPGELAGKISNKGTLKGDWVADGTAPFVGVIKGKKALIFNGQQSFRSSFNVPVALTGNNSYTVYYAVYCDDIKDENPLLSWTAGNTDHTNATFGYGSNTTWGAAQHNGVSDFPFTTIPNKGEWHDIVVTFDGSYENLYVDGKLNNSENKMLFLKPAQNLVIGSGMDKGHFFNGAVAAIKVFSGVCADSVIQSLSIAKNKTDLLIYMDAAELNYGKLGQWVNNGVLGGTFSNKTGTLSPVVTDVDGKIAVNMSGNKHIVFDGVKDDVFRGNQAYTITSSIYLPATGNTKSGWHHVVKVSGNKYNRLFIDGQAVNDTLNVVYRTANKLFNGLIQNGELWGVNGALSMLAVYSRQLSAAEISALSNLWKKSLWAPFQQNIAFEQAPKAISPTMVEMSALTGNNGSNLKYLFTGKVNGTTFNSGWISKPYYLASNLEADKQYVFTFKVKDNFGNVSKAAPLAPVNTAKTAFNYVEDDFKVDIDLLQHKNKLPNWQYTGVFQDTATHANVVIDSNALTLSSKGTNWDGNLPHGPFVYKEVSGDFVAEVKVTDITGLSEQKVKGNHEAGLMVRLAPDNQTGQQSEVLLQNGIFPAWKCGNLVTNLQNGQRNQYNTQSGWAYYPYLQIQKKGDLFYLRISNDGRLWLDAPGSPFARPDLNGRKLQIGLYQCTYGPQSGFGTFKNFRLSTPR